MPRDRSEPVANLAVTPTRRRLLLLLPTTTYRTEAFVSAALRLDADLTVASERDSAFSAAEPDRLLTLDFAEPRHAVEQARACAAHTPIHGVFGVDDRTALIAAMIAETLGLPHNPIAAMRAAGDKYLQRQLLRDAGVPVPKFQLRALGEPTAPRVPRPAYPVVVKPLHLSASRGVIKAETDAEFDAACRRLRAMLESDDVIAQHGASGQILVESFVPGPEFALEGLVQDGALHVLALFDKPDPLEGPFFEETIYTTPSRHPSEVQDAIVRSARYAVRGLGLTRGPVHAELRHNDRGAWLIELAARPIGGKCGQVLRFGDDASTTLEELHLAHALGLRDDVPPREPDAAGVMMIPVPRAGVLREVRGVEQARAVPLVTDVIITVHRGQHLRPLPEEARYLGFIFARADEPGQVERALRAAHRQLDIVIDA